MKAIILSIVLSALTIQLAESVLIAIVYGATRYTTVDVPHQITVDALKHIIADKVGICAEDQQIIDVYSNPVQEFDGWGQFLDVRRLVDYGITEYTTGKILFATRRVTINNLIAPSKTQLTVVYLDNSAIRIPIDGYQTIQQLKQFLAMKLDIPILDQVIVDWFPNNLMESDGGQALDGRTLSEYGYNAWSTGKIITVAVHVPNYLTGTLTIIYGSGSIQFNIPFDENETVLDLKSQLAFITGILPQYQAIVDYYPNPEQDRDNGVWQDNKKLIQYGMRNGKPTSLLIGNTGGTELIVGQPAY